MFGNFKAESEIKLYLKKRRKEEAKNNCTQKSRYLLSVL